MSNLKFLQDKLSRKRDKFTKFAKVSLAKVSTNKVISERNAYSAVQRSTVARIFNSGVPPTLAFNLTAVATTEL